MPGQVTVTYFHHSGFMAAVEDTLLIFDYWRGEKNNLTGETALSEADLKGYRQVLFFVTHEHPDHYDQVIYDFKHLNYVH